MFDIGVNLSNEQFRHDVSLVLENAEKNNVSHILLTSTNLETFNKNLDIIKNNSTGINLKTTYGLHPHNASDNEEIFNHFSKHISNEHVISIGEFGLDYFRMLSPKETQLKVCNNFFELSQNYPEKSLFLHEREAFSDFLAVLKDFQSLSNNKVVHCFSSSKYNMQAYLDENCYIGFTGWISDKRRNQDVLEAIKYIPVERILIETDAPYLTPYNMEKRPKRNEPAYLKYVLMSIAEIKNININELEQIIFNNSKEFFNFN